MKEIKESIIIILIALVCVWLCSCKTQEVVRTEYVTQHDTIHHAVTKHDSIYLHDSIYNEVFIKGDTVLKNKYVYRIEYKDKLLHDSIYIGKTDTVFVDVAQIEEVEKPLTWWQKTINVLGYIMLALMVLGMILFAKAIRDAQDISDE